MRTIHNFCYNNGLILMFILVSVSEIIGDLGFRLFSFLIFILSCYLLVGWYFEGKFNNDIKEYREGAYDILNKLKKSQDESGKISKENV